MELPKTVRPSPLSPHFFYDYVKFGGAALAIVAAVFLVRSYLEFLPFPPAYLILISLVPLVKVVQTEVRRRRREYEFGRDRVKVRSGKRTVHQEDVLYEKITDVSSESPPWEQLADVGDLFLYMTGTDKTVAIIGLRHPDRYEDLLMGREPVETETGGSGGGVQELREQLQELERRYENGEIGRAEYERRYYYLKGEIDALEGGG